MIIFKSILTTFKAYTIFRGRWGCSKNLLDLKVKPLLANLACPNQWNRLYELKERMNIVDSLFKNFLSTLNCVLAKNLFYFVEFFLLVRHFHQFFAYKAFLLKVTLPISTSIRHSGVKHKLS